MRATQVFFSFYFCLGISSMSLGQDPILSVDFDIASFSRPQLTKEAAVYVTDLQQSQYAPGISGKALDLSEDAMLRMPVKLNELQQGLYAEQASFSVQVWVKTKVNAAMGTPIIGNKAAGALTAPGWQLYTREQGAWALNLSDSTAHFDYQPTRERQKINDGRWHHIVISVDRQKQEVWMYFDGINVAIFNIAGLKGLESPLTTVVGGSDEKWEYGSTGQWNAFNGYLDEVKIWDRDISANEVAALYKAFFPEQSTPLPDHPNQIKVMAWNIWHGGHRYGRHVGLQRVIELIKDSNADIVGLIETYGSGAIIADSLGYHFYLISSNLSIMSRFPITETIQAFRAFNFGGAKLQLGPERELVFFDTWLHYLPDYLKHTTAGEMSEEELIKAEGATRQAEIEQILTEIQPYLGTTESTPIIMSGDFNSGSHLDWIPATQGLHGGYSIEWPVSKSMTDAGFKDSYRELHINPLLDPGLTWTPRAATSSSKYGLRDRIDYIYYRGNQLVPLSSTVVDYHPIMFPSDHAAVVSTFQLK